MKITQKVIKQRAAERGIEVFRKSGKTVVTFENGRSFFYSDSLTDVALRIKLISQSEWETIRNSDKRHVKTLQGYEVSGIFYATENEWLDAYFSSPDQDSQSVFYVYKINGETVRQPYF